MSLARAFEQATMIDTSKNLAQYFGAGEDTIYLSGMAAGAATKKGVLGYVVPFPTPEVIRHANAWTLGVQAMHPGAKVKLVWTNSWLDIPKETRAASPSTLLMCSSDTMRTPRSLRVCRRTAINFIWNGASNSASRRPIAPKPSITTVWPLSSRES